MPRTKGSKNKLKITKDYVSQIAEKQESLTSLTAEIESITANIDTALKKAEKEVATLEAKKAEAEAVLKKLVASGMSVDEILEKLK